MRPMICVSAALRLAALLPVALALLLSSPGAAQTPPAPNATLNADRAQLSTCLRASATAMNSCIGAIAIACVRASGTDGSMAEQRCARREEAVWRERLTEALQATGRPLDAARRSRLASLHLAWEGYVAQKCAFYGASQPASLQMGRQAGCELREVANRAIELQRSVVPPTAQRRPQAPPQIIR